jgi:hypothetical protein
MTRVKVQRADDLPQWRCPECGTRWAGDSTFCTVCLADGEPDEPEEDEWCHAE